MQPPTVANFSCVCLITEIFGTSHELRLVVEGQEVISLFLFLSLPRFKGHFWFRFRNSYRGPNKMASWSWMSSLLCPWGWASSILYHFYKWLAWNPLNLRWSYQQQPCLQSNDGLWYLYPTWPAITLWHQKSTIQEWRRFPEPHFRLTTAQLSLQKVAHLVLDYQLLCSSLGKTVPPTLVFLKLVVLCVGLEPHGLLHVYWCHLYLVLKTYIQAACQYIQACSNSDFKKKTEAMN